jgi:hypothetical protein
MVDFGADNPFAGAAHKLKEHYGIEVPISAVRTTTEAHGESIRNNTLLQTEMPDRPGVPQLIAELDGSMIPEVEISPAGKGEPVVGDFVLPAAGGPDDTASSSPGAPGATFADFPGTPADRQDRKRSFADDNQCGVGAGMRADCKSFVSGDKQRAERPADSSDNGNLSSGAPEHNGRTLGSAIRRPSSSACRWVSGRGTGHGYAALGRLQNRWTP